MVIVPEMQKLRDLLDARGIQWEDKSDCFDSDVYYICRTWIYVEGYRVSVINGFGTYGGIGLNNKNRGLLELYSGLTGNEPVGCLTADQVIELLFGE